MLICVYAAAIFFLLVLFHLYFLLLPAVTCSFVIPCVFIYFFFFTVEEAAQGQKITGRKRLNTFISRPFVIRFQDFFSPFLSLMITIPLFSIFDASTI